MKVMGHIKTVKNKRNFETKRHLLQNNKNADTNLLHSHNMSTGTQNNNLYV